MIQHKHFIRLVFVFVALALVIPEDASAQRSRSGRIFRFQNILEHDQRPYHFGFTVGLNTLDFALWPEKDLQEYGFTYVLPSQDYGFHVGIVSNLKLHQYFDLRFIPTFSFGDRYIDYYYGDYEDGYTDRQVLEPYFFPDFPLHIKYKSARMTNTRAYVIGGVKYSYDRGSYEGRQPSGDDPLFLRTAKHDFHYEIGVGFDHYFYYFKFSTEIKASFGFRDLVLAGDDGLDARYWNSIDRLNSRSIMISFLFE